MSLAWISLASNWLEKNCPASKEEALVEITKMMPLGIRRSSKAVVCKVRLAKEAMSRIYDKSFCELPDPLPKLSKESYSKQTGATAKMRELAKSDSGLSKDDVKSFKNGRKLLHALKKSGVLVLDGDVYRIKRGNENEQ